VTDAGILDLRRAFPRAQIRFDRMDRGDPEAEGEFMAYLLRNGIVAERYLAGWSDSWRVIRPATKDYTVVFVLIFFPPDATEQQMAHQLLAISLATMLNAHSHLAMSYPSYTAPRTPESGFPKPEQDPTCKRLIELFKQYKRPSAGSRAQLP
jgi:hypothetical protein